MAKYFLLAFIGVGTFHGLGGWSAQVWSAESIMQNSTVVIPTDTEDLLTEVDRALEQGQADRVREALAKLLQRPNLKPETLLQVGAKLAQQELYAEASRAYARYIKDYPRSFEGYYNLALAEYALTKFPEALTSLKKAPQASKRQEVARLYLRGKIEGAMGQAREAERDLSAAFADAPHEENYALDLGLFYLHQRNYPKAIAVFDRAAKFQNASPFVWLGLSLSQFLGGQPAESVETGKRILALDATFSPARTLMAFALYFQGKFQDAERLAAAGLSAPQPFPYLYYLHAAALLKLNSREYESMLADLAIASRTIPACSLCYLTQSKIHQVMGQLELAKADLEKAVALEPAFPEAWYRLASVYERTGQRQEALEARRKFRELKEEKSNRESEMIRNAFLQALGGGTESQVSH